MQREGRPQAPTGPAAARLVAWSGPLALAAAFCALAAWSWDRWADVQIDFGNELYVAWRLASGDVLYRDIALRSGPLSPYLNAAWFALFGVSIRTLVACNLAILAATCALLWGLLRPPCGRLAATLAGLVFLAAFAFANPLGVGNYNWVTPYQHFQTHGVALGIALACSAGAALRGSRGLPWAVAGLCLGLVFLTKAELFAPAAAVAGAALALEAAAAAPRPARAAGLVAVGASLPVGLALALLAAQMPAALALEGVLGNWTHLAGVASDPFYLGHAGLDAPASNAGRALLAFAELGVFALACAAADRWLPRRLPAFVAALALGATLVALRQRIAWLDLARALPLTSALGAGLLLAACWRRRGDRAQLARLAPLALFALLSLGLLGKIALAARIDHYGFALAMPAALLLVAGLVEGVPRALARGRGRGTLARALAAAAVIAALVALLELSDRRYAVKDFAVGRGADRILAERPSVSPRPARIAEALARLERLVPADASLLVLPEGASINYWLRRRNPSRYLLFLPTEIAAFGEDAMLRDLERHPPDFVVLAHRQSGEFGVGPFGKDPRNGRELLAWVEAGYERVARVGPEPFGRDGFGLVILRRRLGEAAPAPEPVPTRR
jgi:hypothetical protein